VAAAQQISLLLFNCSLCRLATALHVALVVAQLYAFAAPMRPLDLVLNALLADMLLVGVDSPAACRATVANYSPLPGEPESACETARSAVLTRAFVCGSLQMGLSMAMHASPFFKGGSDVQGHYRSGALALQMLVSTALLPSTVLEPPALRAPLSLIASMAISVVWGQWRISWVDVGLLWAWNVAGHIAIFCVWRVI